MLRVSSGARRIFAAAFRLPVPLHFHSNPFLGCPDNPIFQSPLPRSFSSQSSHPSSSGTDRIHEQRDETQAGASHDIQMPSTRTGHLDPSCSTMNACSSSAHSRLPTAIVKDLYIKMLEFIEAETMPPVSWLWSLTKNCQNREDIVLLFQILQELQRFKLSKRRTFANFSCDLCARVAETCAHIGAVDFGLRTLWGNNVYGLTPTACAAYHLLSYAKKQNDSRLMEKIMKFLEKNWLPLESSTADLVFSICYNTDNWHLISKYSKKFVRNGVQLNQRAFNIWMEFAAKTGDAKSIWEIESLRSNSVKQHSLESGFSCAKGYLLEHKPEHAAAIVHFLYQTLPHKKRQQIGAGLQSLENEWLLNVIHRKKDGKELAKSLRTDINTMLNLLLSMGLGDLISSKDVPH